MQVVGQAARPCQGLVEDSLPWFSEPYLSGGPGELNAAMYVCYVGPSILSCRMLMPSVMCCCWGATQIPMQV